MDKKRIDILTHGRSTSAEYRKAVKEATNLELKVACSLMYGKSGCKGRLNVCDAEFRIRGVKW